MRTKTARALVYVGELSRCEVPGVPGEFQREAPIRIAEDGWKPPEGEPRITPDQAESLVEKNRTVGYETSFDAEGNAVYAKVVTEPFRIIRIRVRDEEVGNG